MGSGLGADRYPRTVRLAAAQLVSAAQDRFPSRAQAQVTARLVRVHPVVALALPAVEAFDLAIPAQVFGDRRQGGRYSFTVCAPVRGLVPSTTGYAINAAHGLERLAGARV